MLGGYYKIEAVKYDEAVKRALDHPACALAAAKAGGAAEALAGDRALEHDPKLHHRHLLLPGTPLPARPIRGLHAIWRAAIARARKWQFLYLP